MYILSPLFYCHFHFLPPLSTLLFCFPPVQSLPLPHLFFSDYLHSRLYYSCLSFSISLSLVLSPHIPKSPSLSGFLLLPSPLFPNARHYSPWPPHLEPSSVCHSAPGLVTTFILSASPLFCLLSVQFPPSLPYVLITVSSCPAQHPFNH